PIEKDETFLILVEAFKMLDVASYAVACESWSSATPSFRGPPKLDPNRTEVMMIVAVDKSGSVGSMANILRDAENKPTLGPWEDNGGIEGRLSRLLDRGAWPFVGGHVWSGERDHVGPVENGLLH